MDKMKHMCSDKCMPWMSTDVEDDDDDGAYECVTSNQPTSDIFKTIPHPHNRHKMMEYLAFVHIVCEHIAQIALHNKHCCWFWTFPQQRPSSSSISEASWSMLQMFTTTTRAIESGGLWKIPAFERIFSTLTVRLTLLATGLEERSRSASSHKFHKRACQKVGYYEALILK